MHAAQDAPRGARPLTLADFEGRWSLVREIEGPEGRARFEGEARLIEAKDHHLWVERGALTMPHGASVPAERRYLWREGPEGIEVLFEDGRPFHVIRQDGGEIVHDCPPDTYRGAYDFGAFPVWRLTWRVTGPRKDYLSQTVHRRLAPSARPRDTAADHA